MHTNFGTSISIIFTTRTMSRKMNLKLSTPLTPQKTILFLNRMKCPLFQPRIKSQRFQNRPARKVSINPHALSPLLSSPVRRRLPPRWKVNLNPAWTAPAHQDPVPSMLSCRIRRRIKSFYRLLFSGMGNRSRCSLHAGVRWTNCWKRNPTSCRIGRYNPPPLGTAKGMVERNASFFKTRWP